MIGSSWRGVGTLGWEWSKGEWCTAVILSMAEKVGVGQSRIEEQQGYEGNGVHDGRGGKSHVHIC